MSEKKADQRLHPRHPLKKSVRIEIDGVEVTGDTTDISLGGVSIETDTPLNNDVFALMHIETIGELTGHVVRTTDESFAVEFDPVDEERQRLEKQLKSMFEKK